MTEVTAHFPLRRHHLEMLILSAAAVVFAFVLEVRGADRVGFRGLRWPLVPGTCPSRLLFHMSCPGCGLTRSIVLLASGDWRSSWRMHHLGWLVAIAILAQLPYRLMCLRRERQVFGRLVPGILGYGLVALLFANWLMGAIF